VSRARERAAEARAAISDQFAVDENGKIPKTQGNIRLAMQLLGISVSYDTFQDRLLIEGLEGYGPLLDDRAMVRLRLYIDEQYQFLPAKEFFYDVVADAARHNPFHPVRDYLDGLLRDGTPRLDTWLVTCGGAEDSPYLRAVGTLLLIAGVRRIRQPGVKFDEMPVLEGDQGTNKSSALAALALNEE
jgi:predicted P-loop ATPase